MATSVSKNAGLPIFECLNSGATVKVAPYTGVRSQVTQSAMTHRIACFGSSPSLAGIQFFQIEIGCQAYCRSAS